MRLLNNLVGLQKNGLDWKYVSSGNVGNNIFKSIIIKQKLVASVCHFKPW